LILFRKAHSIRNTGRVASWLHGVARRTALKANGARKTMANDQTLNLEAVSPHDASADAQRRDLECLLDEEIAALPAIYRLPIVLCELEGLSGKEASRQLGWPEGTVTGRLTRGRRKLRDALVRRGVSATMVGMIGMMARESAGSPTPKLLQTTIHGARLLASGKATAGEAFSTRVVALTKGVMKSMFLTKLTGTLLAACAVATAGVLLKETSKPPAAPMIVAPAPTKVAAALDPSVPEELRAEVRDLLVNAKQPMSTEQAIRVVEEKHLSEPGPERPHGGFDSEEERAAHMEAEAAMMQENASRREDPGGFNNEEERVSHVKAEAEFMQTEGKAARTGEHGGFSSGQERASHIAEEKSLMQQNGEDPN
jgi:hypothetical protein